jgi:hypothetical protein
MRHSLLAGFAVGAVAVVGLAPHAHARDYPFCMRGEYSLSPLGDCSFDTLEQCKATASGLLAYCDINPYYAAVQAPMPYPRRSHRRHD